MKTLSILSMALGAAISFAPCVYAQEETGSPTIEGNFTFTPAPGALDFETIQRGFNNLTVTPNTGVTPSVNEGCTENVKFFCNDELLADIAPQYLTFTYIDFHGGFWSGYLNLNPENEIPLEKLQQAGTYKIQFPDNLIQVDGVNTTGCTLTYTYEAPTEGDVNFDSALANVDGDTFYGIYVRMADENLAVSLTDDFKCEMLYNGEPSFTFDNSQASAYSNTFSINFPYEVTENAKPGEYTFIVAPGSLKAVDKVNNVYGFNTNELSYTYTLIASPAVVEMSPANGSAVAELSEVVITFNRLMAESTPWDPSVKLQVMQDGNALDEYEVELYTVEDAYEGNQVIVTINPAITEDGEYSIANIESFINFKLRADDQWPSYWYYGPIECSFTVDSNVGVSILKSENGSFDVFNLDGISVLRKADREALKTLPAGIYVINGKKILVK